MVLGRRYAPGELVSLHVERFRWKVVVVVLGLVCRRCRTLRVLPCYSRGRKERGGTEAEGGSKERRELATSYGEEVGKTREDDEQDDEEEMVSDVATLDGKGKESISNYFSILSQIEYWTR